MFEHKITALAAQMAQGLEVRGYTPQAIILGRDIVPLKTTVEHQVSVRHKAAVGFAASLVEAIDDPDDELLALLNRVIDHNKLHPDATQKAGELRAAEILLESLMLEEGENPVLLDVAQRLLLSEQLD